MTTNELRAAGVYAITLHTPAGRVHVSLHASDGEIDGIAPDGARLWNAEQILEELAAANEANNAKLK